MVHRRDCLRWLYVRRLVDDLLLLRRLPKRHEQTVGQQIMSEELRRQHHQPLHALAFMESRFGQGGTPIYEFFEHVFDMDKAEVDELLRDARYPENPAEALAKKAEESIIKKLTDNFYNP